MTDNLSAAMPARCPHDFRSVARPPFRRPGQWIQSGYTLAAVLLFAGCGRPPEPAAVEQPVARVRTVAVPWSDAAIPVTTQGVLAKRTESALSFKIGGVVRTVAVRAGDRVRAGDELAALDLVEIDAEVARASAAADKARRDVARAEQLFAQNVVAIEQAQDARTGLAMAEAALRTAEFNRRFAAITAPADGVILRREAEPDELVAPGRAVLHFAADAEPWIVRAGLSERELPGIHAGTRAQVRFNGNTPVAATVTQMAGGTDPMTHTVSLEIELRDPPRDLRSGFVARVALIPDAVTRRPEIPLEALVAGDGRAAQVFLLNDDKRSVQRVAVEIEALHDGVAYLATPLREGATLVTTGAEFLTDGAAVEVVP
jgi:membrane fusion protein, multidrug efflux system